MSASVRSSSDAMSVFVPANASTEGGWTTFGAGPSRSGHNPYEHAVTRATVHDVTTLWSASIAGGNFSGSVAVADGKVVVGYFDLDAVDEATGRSIWCTG